MLWNVQITSRSFIYWQEDTQGIEKEGLNRQKQVYKILPKERKKPLKCPKTAKIHTGKVILLHLTQISCWDSLLTAHSSPSPDWHLRQEDKTLLYQRKEWRNWLIPFTSSKRSQVITQAHLWRLEGLTPLWELLNSTTAVQKQPWMGMALFNRNCIYTRAGRLHHPNTP